MTEYDTMCCKDIMEYQIQKIKDEYDAKFKENSFINSCIYRIEVGKDFYIGSTKDFYHRTNSHNQYVINDKKQTDLYNAIRNNNGEYTIIKMWYYPCNNQSELHQEEQRTINNYNPTLNMANAYVDDKRKAEIKSINKKRYDNHASIKIKCKCGVEIIQKNIKRHESGKTHITRMNELQKHGKILTREERNIIYRTENRDKIRERDKINYHNNKNNRKEYRNNYNKEYYQKNREKILKQKKENPSTYYQDNKEKLNKKARETYHKKKENVIISS